MKLKFGPKSSPVIVDPPTEVKVLKKRVENSPPKETREYGVSQSQEILDVSPLQEVRRRSPPKKSKKKKRKTLSSEEVMIEVRSSCFTGLTDDLEAIMGATFDIKMRLSLQVLEWRTR